MTKRKSKPTLAPEQTNLQFIASIAYATPFVALAAWMWPLLAISIVARWMDSSSAIVPHK